MRTFFKTMALAAVLVPTGLLAQTTSERFTRDGVAYRYTVKQDAHGRRVIDGRRLSDGAGFHLIVSGDTVDGVSGGQPVTFRVAGASTVAVAAR